MQYSQEEIKDLYEKLSSKDKKLEEIIKQNEDLRKALNQLEIKDSISNRYCQKEAIISVCEDLEKKQRKMLLVKATGTGKTRTSISIVD